MSEVAEPPTAVAPTQRRPITGDIRLANTLVGTHRELAFAWAGQPARLRFTSANSAPAPSGWLRVRLGEHSVDLGFSALPEPASLGAAFAGIEIAALPEELQLGVLEAWFQEPLAVLQRHKVPAQLEAWQTTEAPVPAAFGWEIALADRERFLSGTLHADAEALAFLARSIERAPVSAARTADAVPFAISVALARVPLPLATVHDLAAGDVIFMPLTPTQLAENRYELWTGERCLARAVRQQQSVKILSMNSSSETKSPTATSGPLPVDELPINLVFDVGQLELSVGQLRTIGEGYTFELPATADRLVTIRANGREIGRGELVELGDKVGVRIANWSLA